MEEEMIKIVKPCRILGFCPYGVLVEEFPLEGCFDPEMRCSEYGHLCPVFVVSESSIDEEEEE